jgi:hypothetical protein
MGSGSNRNQTLTLFLSTTEGYKACPSTTYTPQSFSGTYYTGDFQVGLLYLIFFRYGINIYQGDGKIGLIYVYSVFEQKKNSIRFVQFTTDGTTMTALSVCNGPDNVSAENVRVIVGELNGDG